MVGRTALITGLAQRLKGAGRTVALLRLSGDEHADADAGLFASLPFNTQRGSEPVEPGALPDMASGHDVTLVEAAAGDPAAALRAIGAARALVVAGAESPDRVAEYCQALGGSLAGLILNRVPRRRRDAVGAAFEGVGLRPLALLPEDRTLAAPTIAQVAEALRARARSLDTGKEHLIERPVIASISADPGQGYFAGQQSSAVIVRGDKPDLQLAALNAGVSCLIVTGGYPLLSYVLDRVEEDEIAVLQTRLDTVTTVEHIEAMFAAAPFAGGEAKLRRLAGMLSEIDAAGLTGTD